MYNLKIAVYPNGKNEKKDRQKDWKKRSSDFHFKKNKAYSNGRYSFRSVRRSFSALEI